jgi:DNA primase
MADQTTELIKEKIDIAELVKQYVDLKPAGKNLKGLCPFHKEKSGSFMVNRDRQIWHCFGCGKGGDIFGFLMQYENIEFIEALKVLADKAGITLQRMGSGDQKKYDVLYEINRIAKDYFRSSIQEPIGAPALAYLRDRGLTEATIAEFEIGLALPGSDSLMRHLTKMGYSVTDIERAGLAFKTDRGTYWDRFRARIMFPLHNHFGKVIGFTGRVMPGNESADIGKYVNSPETAIFNKSKLLFGFFKTKSAVREQSTAILVEGQMDFLMAYQDGTKNIVATSGTALTVEHLKLIRRLAENLVLSFDNDSAGRAAAERTIDLAAAQDFNVRVIVFDDPELKDPADIARAKPGHFAKLVASAVPAMEYYFNYYGVATAPDIATKKKGVRQVLTKIKAIASLIEQQHWLSLLSVKSGIPESVLTSEMNLLKIEAVAGRIVDAPTVPVPPQAGTPVSRREETIAARLISLSVANPAVAGLVKANIQLLPDYYQRVFQATQLPKGSPIPHELMGSVDYAYLQSGFEAAPGEGEALIQRLQGEYAANQKRSLQSQIRAAEQSGDVELLKDLMEKYKKLTQLSS